MINEANRRSSTRNLTFTSPGRIRSPPVRPPAPNRQRGPRRDQRDEPALPPLGHGHLPYHTRPGAVWHPRHRGRRGNGRQSRPVGPAERSVSRRSAAKRAWAVGRVRVPANEPPESPCHLRRGSSRRSRGCGKTPHRVTLFAAASGFALDNLIVKSSELRWIAGPWLGDADLPQVEAIRRVKGDEAADSLGHMLVLSEPDYAR